MVVEDRDVLSIERGDGEELVQENEEERERGREGEGDISSIAPFETGQKEK